MLVAGSDGKYQDNNFIFQYPMDEIGAGYWWQLELPDSINPLHFQEIEDENGTFKLLFGGDDGMVYEMFSKDQKNWTLVDGSTEAIRTRFQTKYMRLAEGDKGEDYEGRAQPRLFEMRYQGDVPITWTVTIDTANGNSQPIPTDSVSFNMTFNTSESLLRMPIKVAQPCEYVRITVENNQKNVTGVINGIRIYFRAQPGQFPVETTQMNPSLLQDPQ